jgi:hypothetical protein
VGPCERGEGSPGARRSGPRSAAGRPAGGGEKTGEGREGEEASDQWGHRVRERKRQGNLQVMIQHMTLSIILIVVAEL